MSDWRPCPDFPAYEVSSDGEVRRARDRQTIAQRCGNSGYLQVDLRKPGGRKTRTVHRLVARAFHGEPPTPTHWVAHNDGVQLNNRSANLRWATPKENQADKRLHGTHLLGSGVGTAKLSETQVLDIRARIARGELQREVAALHGVKQQAVSRIVTGDNWGHLDGCA